MANVFLSWGSPNQQQVLTVSQWLEGANVSVWQSIHGMRAADNPFETVLREIEQADLAVFLLSDQVVDRDWVRRELDWCFAEAMRRPHLRILPFSVDVLSPGRFPALLGSLNINIEDIAQLDDNARERTVGTVRKSLGLRPPIAVPATLFAMTRDEFQALTPADWERARQICQTLGMTAPIAESLLARYENDADSFKPFGGQPLKAAVERMFYVANAQKPPSERPLLLQWYTPEQLATDRAIQDLWASQSSSLLFIDSISLAVNRVYRVLTNLPWPTERKRTGVVWLPPYSTHTARVEASILESLSGIVWLRQAFQDFTNFSDPQRDVTFDASSSAALDHWLFRVLTRSMQEKASEGARAAMRNQFAPSGNLNPQRDFNRSSQGEP